MLRWMGARSTITPVTTTFTQNCEFSLFTSTSVVWLELHRAEKNVRFSHTIRVKKAVRLKYYLPLARWGPCKNKGLPNSIKTCPGIHIDRNSKFRSTNSLLHSGEPGCCTRPGDQRTFYTSSLMETTVGKSGCPSKKFWNNFILCPLLEDMPRSAQLLASQEITFSVSRMLSTGILWFYL